MFGKTAVSTLKRWHRCEAGSSEGVELYWLVDYNAKHRGFIFAHPGGSFEGVVCEQMSNPYSSTGIVDRWCLCAKSLGEAISEFETKCIENNLPIWCS